MTSVENLGLFRERKLPFQTRFGDAGTYYNAYSQVLAPRLPPATAVELTTPLAQLEADPALEALRTEIAGLRTKLQALLPPVKSQL